MSVSAPHHWSLTFLPGVHVVFDPVGGPLADEALRCCTWGAHFLSIGFVAGA